MDASARPLTSVAGGGVPAQAREAERRFLQISLSIPPRRTHVLRGRRAEVSKHRGQGHRHDIRGVPELDGLFSHVHFRRVPACVAK